VKPLTITIQGKHKLWSFTFEGDPAYLEEWRRDGLEIDEVISSVEVPWMRGERCG
jgi:hypothetical protein